MEQIFESSGDPASFDLGRLIGRREALAAVSGKCSASEALTFQRIRQGKLYRQLNLTWEECCQKLGVNRRQVERILALLDEFGPQYFEVVQFQHMTVDEYRLIASKVSPAGVHLDGAVIALLPENRDEVSAAVTELVQREKTCANGLKAPPSFAAMVKRCEALIEAIEQRTAAFDEVEKMRISTAVSRLRRAAAKKGAPTL